MIKILEKQVSDKIAAGEVVDRPVSIVKELTENAIDAKASSIVVEIKKGGKTYIRVTDNGCGIPADQVNIAFLRHATSKIDKAEDLNSLITLGFRGEALASIAAVSRVELITKTPEKKMGTKLLIEGGVIIDKQPTGCPDGTTVIIRDLFYNTPARLKFMKSDSGESSQITEFISDIALAFPDIKIRMINNENILFSTRGVGNRFNTIATLIGKETVKTLVPVSGEAQGLHIDGYVSGPASSRSSRKYQVFFVNKRVINSKIIGKGLSEAYSDRLFSGRYPVAYLFLQVDPKTVDVNIHPNKKEVRFNDEQRITTFVKETIKEALNVKEAVPDIELKKPQYTKKWKASKPESNYNNKEKIQKNEIGEQVDIKTILSTFKEENKKIAEEVNQFKAEIRPEKNNTSFDFKALKTGAVLFGTYIIANDNDYFYLIDQHAAHERIFFEKFMNQYETREKLSQDILIPVTLEGSFEDNKWIEFLNQLGFKIENFGPKTWITKAIPAFMDQAVAKEFLEEFMDTYDGNTDWKSKKTIDMISTQACKSAVKANDHLSEREVDKLINDLAQCKNPFSCPHGRPTFVKLSKSDIEKRFKRT